MDETTFGWETRECKDYPGRAYFVNSFTGESSWISPAKETKKKLYLQLIVKKYNKSINPTNLTEKEALEKIKSIKSRIGTDILLFEQIANEESDINVEKNGGALGWVSQKEFSEIKDFANIAWALKPGEISDFFDTPLGYMIVLRRE